MAQMLLEYTYILWDRYLFKLLDDKLTSDLKIKIRIWTGMCTQIQL